MICTVANYEYCFYYYFYQDGTIEHEIRLTGILNVYVLAEGEDSSPFGTQVAPRINAQYHQHVFSYRIDPMIDGLKNSVVESDIVSYDYPTGSKENFAGNAFIVKEKILKNTDEGVRVYDEKADRRWRIVNGERLHYASGKAVGYVLGIKGATTELLAKEGGWASRRAAFARKSLWVVRDREEGDGVEREDRLYPAGKYVPQTRSDPENSVLKWSQEGKSIDGEDILLFVTLGQYCDLSSNVLLSMFGSRSSLLSLQASPMCLDLKIGQCKSIHHVSLLSAHELMVWSYLECRVRMSASRSSPYISSDITRRLMFQAASTSTASLRSIMPRPQMSCKALTDMRMGSTDIRMD